MGAFVLLRRDRFRDGEADEKRVFAALEEQGFAPLLRRASPEWTLLACGKYAGQPPALYERDADNFALATGTLMFRGKSGACALALLFDGLDGTTLPWDEMHGSYAIICRRNGRLTLLSDRLGVYKLYRDDAGTVIASSFLATLAAIERPRIERQALYEYVFQGASFDGRTVIAQIRLMERNAIFRLGREIAPESLRETLWDGAWSGYEDHLARAHDSLRAIFGDLVAGFAPAIDAPLSGGFDSRLILALLREQGARPRVHVYGRPDDEDVRLAQAMAAGEDFTLRHIDKSHTAKPDPAELPAIVQRNFTRFDGYPDDGIFDHGSDLETRLERAAGGAIALNGGGGEIFRNFFYLPDRPISIRRLLWSFFSQFDPAICTAAFVEAEYLHAMAVAIARLVGAPTDDRALDFRLARREVEFLYPILRCVYWMGRNNSVNNRFGAATTPLMEPSTVRLALQIPIAWKNYGRFEAALICRADPALGRYPSSYGANFTAEPSWQRRLKSWLTMERPALARRYSYRARHRFRPDELGAQRRMIAGLVDPAFPVMQRYFHIDKVGRARELNRIATLEYLFQRCGAESPI